MAGRCKAFTDKPVLVRVGVSNATQAAQAVTVADGVIQGASVVRRLLDGGPRRGCRLRGRGEGGDRRRAGGPGATA
jgi:tryptophan synthase alpha subunit